MQINISTNTVTVMYSLIENRLAKALSCFIYCVSVAAQSAKMVNNSVKIKV